MALPLSFGIPFFASNFLAKKTNLEEFQGELTFHTLFYSLQQHSCSLLAPAIATSRLKKQQQQNVRPTISAHLLRRRKSRQNHLAPWRWRLPRPKTVARSNGFLLRWAADLLLGYITSLFLGPRRAPCGEPLRSVERSSRSRRAQNNWDLLSPPGPLMTKASSSSLSDFCLLTAHERELCRRWNFGSSSFLG